MALSKFTITSKKIISKIFHGLGIINLKPLQRPVASQRGKDFLKEISDAPVAKKSTAKPASV